MGGNRVFNFLRLPNTAQLTALGSINVSQISNDAGLAVNNPSLLGPGMLTQVSAVFISFYDGINTYHLSLGYQYEKIKTSFLWGLNYLETFCKQMLREIVWATSDQRPE